MIKLKLNLKVKITFCNTFLAQNLNIGDTVRGLVGVASVPSSYVIQSARIKANKIGCKELK